MPQPDDDKVGGPGRPLPHHHARLPDDKLAIRLGEVSDRVASIARRELRSTTSCAQARLWLEIIWWELADLARRTLESPYGPASPGKG